MSLKTRLAKLEKAAGVGVCQHPLHDQIVISLDENAKTPICPGCGRESSIIVIVRRPDDAVQNV